MEYYVGLDVSLKHTSICVVNPTGSIVQEGVVNSDPEAIALFVRSRAPGTVRIGIETGPTTTWLWTELNRLGLPVICIDARHAKAVLKMQINKSDRNDAAGIARIMQTGWFKEVRVTPKHGSWLDLAESELGVLAAQCLDRRIADKQTLIDEIAAWEHDRNVSHTKSDWHFTTKSARVKLKSIPFNLTKSGD